MTAEPDLLPLYAELQGHPKLEIVKHYTRANVAHATAAKDAEIEALRAEVAAWRELSDHVRAGACNAIWPDRYTDARTRDVAASLKRAEPLKAEIEELRAVPEGYALVPVEPTAAMVNAAANYDTGSSDGTVGRFCAGEIWYLMLAAAPSPEQEK